MQKTLIFLICSSLFGALDSAGEQIADEKTYKMWHEAGWFGTVALATSRDGIHWIRPLLDVNPGTNQVLPADLTPDSWTVVPDWENPDSSKRWTMYLSPPVGGSGTGWSLTSADGIHWNDRTPTGIAGDRSTHFYNPFRKKWVYSLRVSARDSILNRARLYYECDDFMGGALWSSGDKADWLKTDSEDPVDYLTREHPQLYNFDAVAYESIMLGMFQIHHGPDNKYCKEAGLPKITELMFAYSRDGFYWNRPDRQAHIAAERHGTLEQMRWSGGSDLSSLSGTPVRICFSVSNGALYSFWISSDESGKSKGYVAGGGPGYLGPTDTVGRDVFDY